MDTLSYRTISANSGTVTKKWYIVDAKGLVLGRLATRVALVLRGKHRAYYTPHADCGDNVIIINAEKIVLTGRKMQDREHYDYTGYPGGFTRTSPAKILQHKPHMLVEQAVRRMLPKNKLGSEIFRNLRVYVGDKHPHDAQNPEVLDLKKIR